MSASPTFRDLIEQTRTTKLTLEDRIATQASEQPAWLTSLDARAAGLQGLWNVLRYVELSLIFLDQHLSDPLWWISLRGGQPPIRQVSFEYSAYSQGSKFGAFHLGTASFENTTRSLLRALAPGAANDARAEFKSVYECLLRTHLKFSRDDLALLDLIRLVRNTIHNEGLHRPPSGLAATLVYKGHTYDFNDSGPIEFVTWAFVIERLGDLAGLLDRMVRADAIWSLPLHISADWAEPLPSPAA